MIFGHAPLNLLAIDSLRLRKLNYSCIQDRDTGSFNDDSVTHRYIYSNTYTTAKRDGYLNAHAVALLSWVSLILNG